MFYYFGRKGRLAKFYPSPEFGSVIEPFAGSMAYTLYHKPHKAIGVEIDKAVCDVWWKICALSEQEILDYPEPNIGDRVYDRWCMMAGGSHGTARAKSYLWTNRMSVDFSKQKRMAAKNLDYAKNVDYRHGTYKDTPNIESTWFIDPPYQKVNRGYHRDGLDYSELASWCRSRKGLVIVCEQAGANWLPFEKFQTIKGTNNKTTEEVFWTNR